MIYILKRGNVLVVKENYNNGNGDYLLNNESRGPICTRAIICILLKSHFSFYPCKLLIFRTETNL